MKKICPAKYSSDPRKEKRACRRSDHLFITHESMTGGIPKSARKEKKHEPS
jgi:hypothetical protein